MLVLSVCDGTSSDTGKNNDTNGVGPNGSSSGSEQCPNATAGTSSVDFNSKTGRALKIGDRMEFELSQFLDGAPNGRNNYYGTTYLYIVGRGLVPWEARGVFRDSSTPIALEGETLFKNAACNSCHVDTFQTSYTPIRKWSGGKKKT